MDLNLESLLLLFSRKKPRSKEIAIIAVNQHYLVLPVHTVMAFIVQTIDYQRNIIVQAYIIVEKFFNQKSSVEPLKVRDLLCLTEEKQNKKC